MPEEKRKEPAWGSSSFERALAPLPGQHIREALLTTYSADLPAIVVALQAMAGYSTQAGDRIGPGKLTLVQTLDRLRGVDIRIAVQTGRLRGATRAKIGGLLDQFLYQVQHDEEVGSWHPKMALLRFGREEEQPGEDEWRFWMGSRNLSSSENAELGLCLESATGGTVIGGLGGAVRKLAVGAGYSVADANSLATRLGKVSWTLPSGCRALDIFSPSAGLPTPGAPVDKVDELIVVSPFLNVETLRQMGDWGSQTTKRSLVSTRLAMGEIVFSVKAPLAHFDRLLELQSPEQEAPETADEQPTESGALKEPPLGDEEFTPYRRLHAKLIAIRQGRQHTFWMGSANATNRGWSGRNTELVARMEVDRTMWAGLEAWVNRAGIVQPAELVPHFAEDTSQQCLEHERKRLAAQWKGVLSFGVEHTRLVAGAVCPSPADPAVELRAGLYTTDERQLWPSASREILLAPASLAEQTGLVRIELRHADGTRLEWLLCCTCDPGLTAARDVAALSEYLGPETLLAWWKAAIRSESGAGTGDEPWDEGASALKSVSTAERADDRLTLEDMLRGWARSPAVFKREGAKIAGYLAHWQNGGSNSGEAEQELAEMHRLWRMMEGEAE